MFRKGPIPPLVHGLLDYGLGALLIAAPFIFGFTADAATAASIVGGVLVLVIAATTAWAAGIIASIPVGMHAVLDYVLACVAIALPFIFAFSSDDGTATAFFIVVGVADLLLAIATRFLPGDDLRASRRRRRRGPAQP